MGDEVLGLGAGDYDAGSPITCPREATARALRTFLAPAFTTIQIDCFTRTSTFSLSRLCDETETQPCHCYSISTPTMQLIQTDCRPDSAASSNIIRRHGLGS